MQSLKISRPDIAEGKNGPELRGVFWKDPLPEVSYFVIRWDPVGGVFAFELYASAIASELRTAVGGALEVIATQSSSGPGENGRWVLKWNVGRDQAAAVSKKMGEVLGVGWEEPIAKLLATGARNGQTRSPAMWYGVPREQIPWFPIIDLGGCDGCAKCVEFCQNDVLRLSGAPPRAEVANPFNCLIGCNSCEGKCPSKAISFPPREILQTFRSPLLR